MQDKRKNNISLLKIEWAFFLEGGGGVLTCPAFSFFLGGGGDATRNKGP